jgi:predicted DCC family thiol-disulfide oxidoreductase YuxK
VPETGFHTLVLYDGVCGLCNSLNQFLLKRDVKDRFRFASLQSDLAASLLRRFEIHITDLDTVYVIADFGRPDQRLLARSDAALHVIGKLDGPWGLLRLGKILPRSLRDGLYNVVARNRYRIFGKHEACLIPEERYRAKFLDQVDPLQKQ